jgi:hypothetical protein
LNESKIRKGDELPIGVVVPELIATIPKEKQKKTN